MDKRTYEVRRDTDGVYVNLIRFPIGTTLSTGPGYTQTAESFIEQLQDVILDMELEFAGIESDTGEGGTGPDPYVGVKDGVFFVACWKEYEPENTKKFVDWLKEEDYEEITNG